MTRGHSYAGAKPPVPPHCRECDATRPIAVLRNPNDPKSGHVWLCGSCLYKRDHPDAAPRVLMPSERRPLKKQAERLF